MKYLKTSLISCIGILAIGAASAAALPPDIHKAGYTAVQNLETKGNYSTDTVIKKDCYAINVGDVRALDEMTVNTIGAGVLLSDIPLKAKPVEQVNVALKSPHVVKKIDRSNAGDSGSS